jgi:hypothetical protein
MDMPADFDTETAHALQLIPTSLPCGMSDLGKVIDPSISQLDLPPGAHVSLPFWVAKALLQHSMAEVEPPAVYGERCDALTAQLPHTMPPTTMQTQASAENGSWRRVRESTDTCSFLLQPGAEVQRTVSIAAAVGVSAGC